jgi:hypothetical protein
MDTAADPAVVYSVDELTRLIEDLKHEEPEVCVVSPCSSLPSGLAVYLPFSLVALLPLVRCCRRRPPLPCGSSRLFSCQSHLQHHRSLLCLSNPFGSAKRRRTMVGYGDPHLVEWTLWERRRLFINHSSRSSGRQCRHLPSYSPPPLSSAYYIRCTDCGGGHRNFLGSACLRKRVGYARHGAWAKTDPIRTDAIRCRSVRCPAHRPLCASDPHTINGVVPSCTAPPSPPSSIFTNGARLVWHAVHEGFNTSHLPTARRQQQQKTPTTHPLACLLASTDHCCFPLLPPPPLLYTQNR